MVNGIWLDLLVAGIFSVVLGCHFEFDSKDTAWTMLPHYKLYLYLASILTMFLFIVRITLKQWLLASTLSFTISAMKIASLFRIRCFLVYNLTFTNQYSTVWYINYLGKLVCIFRHKSISNQQEVSYYWRSCIALAKVKNVSLVPNENPEQCDLMLKKKVAQFS